jgi:hypothetical protein
VVGGNKLLIDVDLLLSNRRNTGVLRYLKNRVSTTAVPSISPDVVVDPYMSLGTRPDLVSRLWNELTKELPVLCRWVVFGVPALVRPDSSIIFAFAHGTHIYALRLAPPQREELMAAALKQAQERSDKSGLTGNAREKYLRAKSGNVHRYSNGSTFDITTIGEEWALGRWLPQEVKWCRSAYENAA